MPCHAAPPPSLLTAVALHLARTQCTREQVAKSGATDAEDILKMLHGKEMAEVSHHHHETANHETCWP